MSRFPIIVRVSGTVSGLVLQMRRISGFENLCKSNALKTVIMCGELLRTVIYLGGFLKCKNFQA